MTHEVLASGIEQSYVMHTLIMLYEGVLSLFSAGLLAFAFTNIMPLRRRGGQEKRDSLNEFYITFIIHIYICKNHPSAFLTCANPRATRAQTEPNATENQQLPPASPCGPHRRPP